MLKENLEFLSSSLKVILISSITASFFFPIDADFIRHPFEWARLTSSKDILSMPVSSRI